MALEAMNFGDGAAAAERAPLFRHARRARQHLAWLLLLSVAACSGDDKTSDDDDGKSSGSANADDDDDDDDAPKKDAGSSTKKDAGSSGGTMRSDGGRIDSGMVAGNKSDAGGPDAGGKSDSSAGQVAGGACTRENVKALIDKYFDALEAHDPSSLPLASNVKSTENGETVEVGKGFWQTAGASKFKRNAIDTETCSSVTESVIAEGSTDIVLGLRLKLVDEKLTEIESIIVRSGDYFSNPAYLASTADDDWESVLPSGQQPTREFMTELIDRYFKIFPRGACNFAATGCERAENGFVPPGFDCDDGLSCDMTTDISRMEGAMKPRLHVLDVEAGIAVGFTMFQRTYVDFHMFKIRMGEVQGVHAVLATASSSGWD